MSPVLTFIPVPPPPPPPPRAELGGAFLSFRGIQRQQRLPSRSRCTWTPPRMPWGSKIMSAGRRHQGPLPRPLGVRIPDCPLEPTHAVAGTCWRPGCPSRWPPGKTGVTALCPPFSACMPAPQHPSLPLPTALQFMEERDDLSSSSAAQWVAQGHCTPQRVHLLGGES